MDKAVEQRLKRRVLRMVASELADAGFSLTKPTFLTREGDLVTPFLHFHKFTFKPGFRAHVGVRVMNDPHDSIVLNGPSKEHLGEFSEREEDVLGCIERIVDYCRGEALPWIERWVEPRALLRRWGSPIKREQQDALRDALAGRANPQHVAQSMQLLGLGRK